MQNFTYNEDAKEIESINSYWPSFEAFKIIEINFCWLWLLTWHVLALKGRLLGSHNNHHRVLGGLSYTTCQCEKRNVFNEQTFFICNTWRVSCVTETCRIFFYRCTVHSDICRVHSLASALFNLKNTLKFTLKYT